MSTPKKFGGAVDIRALSLIPFEFAGQTFRATPKPPLKLIEALMAVSPDEQGKRRYASSLLLSSLEAMVVEKAWDPAVRAETQTADEEPLGAWVEVDDRARMREVLYGEQWVVPIESIAEIVMWLVEETTGDPTGAPRA